MEKLYKIKSEWEIEEASYTPDENLYFESIFTLGNGYMASRGMLEEGVEGDSIPGIYTAGVFDRYNGELYELVTLPNIFECNVFIDGEKMSFSKGKVSHYSRTLDMKRGVLRRSFEWEFSGKRTSFEIKRFISMKDVHLAAAQYKIIPRNYSGKIEIESQLDKKTGNIDWGKNGTFELSEARHYHFDWTKEEFQNEKSFLLSGRTKVSGIQTVQAVGNSFYTQGKSPAVWSSLQDDSKIGNSICFNAEEATEYVYEKKIAVFTSRDDRPENIEKYAMELIGSHKRFDDILKKHVAIWNEKWENSDIKITGNPEDQIAVRFNIFHMIQANAENDPFVSIGGRLLGSEVFNGGVFWDTDIFVLPFFIYNNPTAAKNLLLYRYNTLDKAREKARKHWLKGAMYPWTSVYDGREQCAFWEYANVEVHLIADIAYSVKHYFDVSGDEDFLMKEGLEILIETARFWESRFILDDKSDRYHLILVQGPDEYTGPVNNDTYTLIMAGLNFKTAIETLKSCKLKYPEKWEKIKNKISFKNEELEKWEKIGEKIYNDYHDKNLKILATDEVFSRRIAVEPSQLKVPNKMLRFTMPSYDTLLRYQIVKQPSIILLTYLLPDRFSQEEKLANWNYYEPKTIHDSSLSYNTHSIMASELGFKKKAYEYFVKTAHLDLNKSRDTDLGLHSACIGGTWQAIVNGFAGMRLRNGILDFAPSIPEEWTVFEFKIHYRNNVFRIRVDKSAISIEAGAGDSSGEITICGQPVELTQGRARVFKCKQ